ncbi:hypothetical protein BST61_g2286 [Cercospora zeina]
MSHIHICLPLLDSRIRRRVLPCTTIVARSPRALHITPDHHRPARVCAAVACRLHFTAPTQLNSAPAKCRVNNISTTVFRIKKMAAITPAGGQTPNLWTAQHETVSFLSTFRYGKPATDGDDEQKLTRLQVEQTRVDEMIDVLRQRMCVVDGMLQTVTNAILAADREEQEAIQNECAIEDDDDDDDDDDSTVICLSTLSTEDEDEDITSTEAVLYYPPLLAQILRHLPATTLFGIQRVNRAFLYTICTSPLLRQNLLIDSVPNAESDIERFASLSQLLESSSFKHAVQPFDFQLFSPTTLGISVEFGAARKFDRRLRRDRCLNHEQPHQRQQEEEEEEEEKEEEEETFPGGGREEEEDYVTICLNWKDILVPGPMQIIYHRWQPRVPVGFGHVGRDATLGELTERAVAFAGSQLVVGGM